MMDCIYKDGYLCKIKLKYFPESESETCFAVDPYYCTLKLLEDQKLRISSQ